MKKSVNGIGAVVSGVVIFTIISKLMGFLREVILSYYFGATGISDAYLISQTIPGTIFQFVGTGLTTCFIPIYYMILRDKDKNETLNFTNKILSMVFIFSTIVIILIWSFTPMVIKLFASGFTDKTLYFAKWFTRIGVLSLYFSSMIYVYNSYLQANNIFVSTAFAAIPNSIFIMFSIYVGAKYNIWFLSIGSTLAVGIQLLFIIPFLVKTKYKLRLNFRLNDKYIKKFFYLMGPVIIGVSVNEINTLVDRTIVSQIAIGGISALTYANSLIQLIQGGLVQPIATVCYPKITATISKGDNKNAKNLLEDTLVLTLNLLIPITIGFIMYNKEIVTLLFGRGIFDETAIQLTSVGVCFYAIGICFIGIRELLSRYFYANSDTKTPMKNASIGVVINIVMNLLLSKYIGVGGLALATSISAIATTVLLMKDTKKILYHDKIGINKIQVFRTILASVIMILISKIVFLFCPLQSNVSLIIAIFVAVVVYGLLGLLFKIKICVDIKKSIFKYIKN